VIKTQTTQGKTPSGSAVWLIHYNLKILVGVSIDWWKMTNVVCSNQFGTETIQLRIQQTYTVIARRQRKRSMWLKSKKLLIKLKELVIKAFNSANRHTCTYINTHIHMRRKGNPSFSNTSRSKFAICTYNFNNLVMFP
jgi:hypothetical protein